MWNIIQAGKYIGLHSLNIRHERRSSITEFGCFPMLLNKIDLTVIFRIEITEVATAFNELSKLRFLSNKIRLVEYDSLAPSTPWGRPDQS